MLAFGSAAPARAQRDPRTALLERDGWTALSTGHGAQALELFEQAIAADPKNARLYLGAAASALIDRREAQAQTLIDRALALDPDSHDARELLGQIRYKLGDLDGAIRTYSDLVPIAPERPAVADTLARWRREADLRDRMQQSVGAHFLISFEGAAEAALAEQALASLDRAYWRIGDLLGTFPSEPVPVVIYSERQFSDLTRSPAWAAAAYDGTIRIPMRGALDHDAELDRVLAHEFTHALLRRLSARAVPTWLNEGLATALEAPDLTWADRQLAAAPRLPLSKLSGSFGGMSDGEAAIAYATSAVAVRRLIDEAGGFAVANLLRDLGAGLEFDAAFIHRIQRPFAEFAATLP